MTHHNIAMGAITGYAERTGNNTFDIFVDGYGRAEMKIVGRFMKVATMIWDEVIERKTFDNLWHVEMPEAPGSMAIGDASYAAAYAFVRHCNNTAAGN